MWCTQVTQTHHIECNLELISLASGRVHRQHTAACTSKNAPTGKSRRNPAEAPPVRKTCNCLKIGGGDCPKTVFFVRFCIRGVPPKFEGAPGSHGKHTPTPNTIPPKSRRITLLRVLRKFARLEGNPDFLVSDTLLYEVYIALEQINQNVLSASDPTSKWQAPVSVISSLRHEVLWKC